MDHREKVTLPAPLPAGMHQLRLNVGQDRQQQAFRIVPIFVVR